MRIQNAVSIALIVFLANSPAWSQGNPFGENSGKPAGGTVADPFGADPFAGSPQQKKSGIRKPAKAKHIKQASGLSSSDVHPIYVARVSRSETEAKICAALDDETSQTFIDTPLKEAVQVISETHDLPIIVDRRALEEIGLSSDEPVTLSLKSVTLRSFLRLMLRELDLTYLVQDDVMQITTVEAAEQNLSTAMYRLPDSLVSQSDKVLKALQGAVVPDTWSTLGGPSAIAAIDHVLIVSTTSDVHDQVEEFLNTLTEAHGK